MATDTTVAKWGRSLSGRPEEGIFIAMPAHIGLRSSQRDHHYDHHCVYSALITNALLEIQYLF